MAYAPPVNPDAPPPDDTKGGLYPTFDPGAPMMQPPVPYQQPPPGYTATTYYPPPMPQQQPLPPGPMPLQPAQQQQQQYVVAMQPQQPQPQQQPMVIAAPQQPVPSFVCHIIFSCVVFWCCFFGCICALTAFVLALIAQHQAAHSPKTARQLGIASITLSIIGIFVFVIILVLVLFFGFISVAADPTQVINNVIDTVTTCPYKVNDICFRYRMCDTGREACAGYFYTVDGCCYMRN